MSLTYREAVTALSVVFRKLRYDRFLIALDYASFKDGCRGIATNLNIIDNLYEYISSRFVVENFILLRGTDTLKRLAHTLIEYDNLNFGAIRRNPISFNVEVINAIIPPVNAQCCY